MPYPTPRRLPRQAATRRRLARADALPFAEHLPRAQVQQALDAEHVTFRERLFAPAVTLWVFLSQLLDADHSCRQAVARYNAYRAHEGLPPAAPTTAAYCKARSRLPEGVLARLTRASGRRLLGLAPAAWLWRGRAVKVVDGTTVSMPDTPENQRCFPQPPAQRPGLGFPLARLVVLFSLAVGTVLDAALGRYQGKGTGEPALFRPLRDGLDRGDVVLADRYYGSYFELAALRARGADLVTRLHQRRRVDFRRGLRLGPGDHLVFWERPPRPAWMGEEEYARVPRRLLVREVRVRVRQPGFRARDFVVVTTLLDERQAPREELAGLYRARWQAELDLRSLKDVLQMDVLRGQTPGMVCKEVWGHLLAYNVVRSVMAAAAEGAGVPPWEVSFKGALQTFNAHWPYLLTARGETRQRLVRELVKAVGAHRVGDRPGRYEPRAVKRRPKPHPLLTEPRAAARRRLARGG